jgi:hypothetical protein
MISDLSNISTILSRLYQSPFRGLAHFCSKQQYGYFSCLGFPHNQALFPERISYPNREKELQRAVLLQGNIHSNQVKKRKCLVDDVKERETQRVSSKIRSPDSKRISYLMLCNLTPLHGLNSLQSTVYSLQGKQLNQTNCISSPFFWFFKFS